jgi:hypothetical protein
MPTSSLSITMENLTAVITHVSGTPSRSSSGSFNGAAWASAAVAPAMKVTVKHSTATKTASSLALLMATPVVVVRPGNFMVLSASHSAHASACQCHMGRAGGEARDGPGEGPGVLPVSHMSVTSRHTCCHIMMTA